MIPSTNFNTEAEVMAYLLAICKEYVRAPMIMVFKRETASYNKPTVSRNVTFAIAVPRGEVELVDKLTWDGLDNNYIFAGSEINLQEQNEVEYLYVIASITAKREET